MNQAVLNAAINIASDGRLCWDQYDDKKIVISGATGLIGKMLAAVFLARKKLYQSEMTVTCLVRDIQKAAELYGESANECLFLTWDASSSACSEIESLQADRVFHCANMTNSFDFINQPVEVINTTVDGARAMLELARNTGAYLCLLSTMEIYGEIISDAAVGEDQGGFLDSMALRNCYPEAKRLDEALCAAYAAEYGVHSISLRLAQTFGPGVKYDDSRVFAEFARCALEERDIVMLTDGHKLNSYLYVGDAVRAMLIACAYGTPGSAYNVANEDTLCEIRDMAEMVASHFGNGVCSVRYEADENAAKRFRKGSKLRLDITRIRSLGWEPEVGLEQMYSRMIDGWREERQ